MNERFDGSKSNGGNSGRVGGRTAARYASMLVELEQRIAFDGAAAETLERTDGGDMADAAADSGADADSAADAGGYVALVDALVDRAADAPQGEASLDPPTQIVFIDSRVEHPEKLLAEIGGDYEIVMIDAERDGVAQIAEALAGRENVDAVHILSHGGAGNLMLGSGEVDYATITGEYADEFEAIGASLSENADILIYGCDFADGAEGARATQALAALTGADIAASTDDTGAAEFGGDWVLEAETGTIEAAALSPEGWDHLLAPPSLSTFGPNLVSNGSFGTTARDRAGWTAESGLFEVNPISSYGVAASPDGGYVAEVEGAVDSTYVETTVATEVGKTYEYSVYAITRTTHNTGDRGILSVNGNAVLNFTTDGSWKLYTVRFEATSTSTVLRITSDGSTSGIKAANTDGVGLIVDGVSLREVRSADYTASYTENGTGVGVVNPDLVIRDSDATTLASATVKIANFQAGDELFTSGTLPSGITASYASTGANAGTLTLSGSASLANYEAALDLVQYRSTSEDPSTTPRTIDVTVNDGTNSSGAAVTTLAVARANDAPVLGDRVLTYTAQEDDPSPTGAVGSLVSAYTGGITDVDSGAKKGIAITGNAPSNGVWWYTTNGGTTWQQVGTVSNASALLLADNPQTRLYFQATTADYNGSGGTSALTFRAWDQTSGTAGGKVTTATNGGTSAFSTATDTVAVTIAAVNDAPVLVDQAREMNALYEDNNSNTPFGGPSGAVGQGVTEGAFYINSNGWVTENAYEGTVLRGIAVVGANTSHGKLWYTIDNGQTWQQIGTVSESNALLLSNASTTRVYFQPAGDYNGTIDDVLTIRAWDQTQGTNGAYFNVAANGTGGSTAFSTATDTVKQTVYPITDATADSVTTPEDMGIVIDVLANDSFENTGRTITAVNGTAIGLNGSVAVASGTVTLIEEAGRQKLRFTPKADYNGSTPNPAFTYTVTSGGLTETANVTVTVTAVGDTPRIDLDTTTSGSGYAATYDQGPAPIGKLVSVTDPENDNLTSMTIRLLNATAADRLYLAASVPGITASSSFDSADNSLTLTLTGNATLANYQTALGSVRFESTSGTVAQRSIVVSAVSAASPTASNEAAATFTPLDSDGDGTANAGDLDDDNDGILDVIENRVPVPSLIDGSMEGAKDVAWTENTNTGSLNSNINGSGWTSYYGSADSWKGSFSLEGTDYWGGAMNGVPGAAEGEVFIALYNGFTAEAISKQIPASAGIQVGDEVQISFKQIFGGVNGVTEPGTQANFIFTIDGVAYDGDTLTYEGNVAKHWSESTITFLATSTAPTIVVSIGGTGEARYLGLDDVRVYKVADLKVARDADGDGIVSRLDLDSDNDGITDNVEAQATRGYILPSGQGAAMADADDDGLDEVYDADSANTAVSASVGLTPVDTDGDGTPDFLDADSDGDGTADIAERDDGKPTSITSTTDSDRDGLLDIFEGSDANDGYDVNDENLTGTTFNLADTDNDTAADGSDAAPRGRDLDYRDNVVIPVVDLDGDNSSGAAGLDYTVTYTEDGAGVAIADADVTITDADSANMTGATVTLANPQAGDRLLVDGSAAASGTLSNGIAWTRTDTVVTLSGSFTRAQYQEALKRITFRSTSQTPSTQPRQVKVTVNDGTNTSAAATTTITVTAVNDAPVNTVPGAQTTAEDATLTFSAANGNAITVNDADGGTLTVMLGVTNGTLTLSGTAGLSFTSGDGTADQTMTFSGTAAEINAALNGASYTPTADYNGSAQLTIMTSDGTLSDSDTVAIAVTAVADIANDNATTNEDTAVTIDVLANDSFENAGRTITAVNGTAIGLNGSVAVASGTVTLIEEAGRQKLRFTPKADYNGSTPNPAFTYTVTSGGLTETADVTVTVTAVADAPRIDLDTTTFGSGYAATYDQGPVPIGKLVSVTDPENDNLTSMTIRLLNATAADRLYLAASVPGITASSSFDSADNSLTLTLTGDATLANYQTALGSVRFESTSGTVAQRSIVVSAVSAASPTASNEAAATFTPLDSDGDGTANAGDIDDDNDGILDTLEYTVYEPADYLGPGNWAIPVLSGAQVTVGSLPALNDGDFDSSLRIDPSGEEADYPDFTLRFDGAAGLPSGGLTVDTFVIANDVSPVDGAGEGDGLRDVTLILFDADGNELGRESLRDLRTDHYQDTNPDYYALSQTYSGVASFAVVAGSSYTYGPQPGNETQVREIGLALRNVALVQRDRDGDGLYDHQDIDSDNDGITDNVEAQATESYILPSGQGAAMADADNDGLDDVYDADTADTSVSASAGLTPVDTDGDGTPDYLDADSDADGIADIAERDDGKPTSVTSTADSDGDGLLDIFEGANVKDGYDVNDENLTGTTFNLADTDNDTAADGSDAAPRGRDLDYRDNVATPVIDLDANNSSGAAGLDYTVNYTEDGAGVAIADADVTITDADSANMTGATVTLANPQAGDRLLVDGSAAASGTLSNGIAWTRTDTVVTLSGSFTRAQYQEALKRITINVLQNDTDPDGDSLSVTSATAGFGTVSINADGTLSYAPAANFNGTDTITYTIADGNGGVSTAQVTITVNAVNDEPTGEDISDEVDNDGQVKTGTEAVDLSVYFSDVDGDDLKFAVITQLPPGLSIDADTGVVSGTVASNASQGGPNGDGVYTVTVAADDGQGGVVRQTFTWTISNLPPTAVNDTLPGAGSVAEDSTTTAVAATDGLLDNDSDPDGDPIRVSAVMGSPVSPGSPATVTGSNGGTFVVNSDGSYSFTPDGAFEDLQAGESRSTTITYTLADSDSHTDTATLTVIVTGVNDAPTVDADGLPDVTKADGASLDAEPLDMSEYFQDVESDTLTFSATGLPAGLSIDAATGEITGTIASNASTMSPYTVTITADDGQGGQVSAEFTFTVTNPAPTAENDAATTSEDTPVDIAVIGNDTDPDGDVLSVDTMVPPAAGNGTVTINADGTLHYVPDPDFYGTDTITYRVTDGQGGYSTGSVTVTVTAVNDPPVVDLDASGAGLGHAAIFTEGDAPVAIADGDAAAFDAEDEIVRLDVTLGGFADGPAEVIGIGAADSVTVGVAGSGTVTFGDTTFAYRYDPATGLAFTNVSGAAVPMPGEDVTALLRAITYQSTTEDPTAGDRTLTFTATDASGATSAAATSTISVAPVNDAPVAADDTVVTDEDVPVTFDPRLNDTDVDGDPLTIGAINGQPIASGGSVAVESGTVTLNANGTLTFTPSANFVGTPSFTYTVNDGAGGTDTAVVLLTVNPVNDAPVANDDTASTVENTPVSGNVLHNLAGRDTDIDGDTLVATAVNGSGANVGPGVTGSGGGTFVIGADGNFTFDPGTDFDDLKAGETRATSIEYTVSDGNGGTDTARLTVVVAGANDAPTATSLPARSDADGAAVSVAAADAFSDADGDPLSYVVTGLPPGLSYDASTGLISGSIDRGASGSTGTSVYSVTVTASDGNGGTVSRSFDWTVTNPQPIARDDAFTIDEDSPLAGRVLADNGSGADSDPDGDPLAVSLVSGPGNGTLVLNADGTFSYTPTDDFHGTDSFVYRIDDGNGGSSTATVSIVVNPVNDVPSGTDRTVTIAEDGSYGFSLADFGFSDADTGDALSSVTITTLPSNGVLTLNGTTVGAGQVVSAAEIALLVFTPDLNENGADYAFFTFQVGDGSAADPTPNTFTFNVDPVNDAPVNTLPATFDVKEDAEVRLTGLSVSDIDAANGPISVTLSVSSGSLSASPAGGVTVSGSGTDAIVLQGTLADINAYLAGASAPVFTPLPDMSGPVALTMTTDDRGNTGSGGALIDTDNAVIFVAPVNDAPETGNAAHRTPEDTPVSGRVVATDVDGDALTFSLTNGPANGTVVVNPDGSYLYTPAPDFSGADTFDIRVDDGHGGTATATVTVTVTPVNDAPVGRDTTVSTTEDTPASGKLPPVTDVDGDRLTYGEGSPPSHGTVTIGTDGSYTYIPDPDFSGTDSFTYTVTDGTETVTYTVTVTVEAVNDAPVGADGAGETEKDRPLTGNLPSATDVDGDPLTYGIGSQPDHGTVEIEPDGTFTYTPAPGFVGSDSFTYTVSDGTVTVTYTMAIAVSDETEPPLLERDPSDDLPFDDGAALPPVAIAVEGAVLDSIDEASALSAQGVIETAVNGMQGLNSLGSLGTNGIVGNVVERMAAWTSFGQLDDADIIRMEDVGSSVAAADGTGGSAWFSADAFKRGNTIYIMISDAQANVDEIRLMRADGRALPNWLAMTRQGVAVGTPPAGMPSIELRVQASVGDTVLSDTFRVDLLTATVQNHVAERRADIGGPLFSDALQTEATRASGAAEDLARALSRSFEE